MSGRSPVDWLTVLAKPTDQIIRERLVSTDEGAGVLWSITPLVIRELSALGATAYEGHADRPAGPSHDWVGFNLLSSAALTSFKLVGEEFLSVDSFYEALKLPEGSAERHVCALAPVQEAKRLTRGLRSSMFWFQGQRVSVGSAEHEAVLAAAVSAKVTQNPSVQIVLRDTGTAKLLFPLTFSPQPGPLARVTPLALMIERWRLLHGRNDEAP